MVVIRLFGNIAGQLGNLDFGLEIFLKTAVKDFPLPGLETVHYMGNASHAVVNRKIDQILINEISIRKLLYVKVDEVIRVVSPQPQFPFIGHF